MENMRDDDTNALMEWTAKDLADRLAHNDPDHDSFVLRVVAARLAERADACTDPLHLVKDLARVSGSMADAVRTIANSSELDPEQLHAARAAISDLDNAHAYLWTLHNSF